MRKTVSLLLAAVLLLALAACSGGAPSDSEARKAQLAVFDTVCSAQEAYALAKQEDLPLIELTGCTGGRETFEAFAQKAERGDPAGVLCAFYYVLDREHMSEELYEQEKDKYPKLFFYDIEFDGKTYSVKIRESSEQAMDAQKKHRYLRRYTGKLPETALFSDYEYYVLTDDPDVTWEEIEAGIFSSRSGASIPHTTVFRDLSGPKEETETD